MRLLDSRFDADVNELKQFSDWLLAIGDGRMGFSTNNTKKVKIPEDLPIDNFDDPIYGIVESTYFSYLEHSTDMKYLQEKTILAPTLQMVESVNDYMISLSCGQEKSYLSFNTVCIPNYSITLKVVVLVMLLRNIDQSAATIPKPSPDIPPAVPLSLESQNASSFNFGQVAEATVAIPGVSTPMCSGKPTQPTDNSPPANATLYKRTLGLHIHHDSDCNLYMYADVDWAGDPNDRVSASGYVLFFGRNPVIWSSKKQKAVARSSIEAEYKLVANAIVKLPWIEQGVPKMQERKMKEEIQIWPTWFWMSITARPLGHDKITSGVVIRIKFYDMRVWSFFQTLECICSISITHATRQMIGEIQLIDRSGVRIAYVVLTANPTLAYMVSYAVLSVNATFFYDCLGGKNKGENHIVVVLDDLALDELPKVKNSWVAKSEYNEYHMFDECLQWVEYEFLVELHSTRITSTTETKILNPHMDSRLYTLVVDNTIPKMMGLNDLSSAYNITTHLGYASLSISKILNFLFKGKGHKIDILLGDKLFNIKLKENILAEFCGSPTTFDLLPYALDLYNCNWVNTGQVFLVSLDRIKSCVCSFSRVLLFSNFDSFLFLYVVDVEAKIPTPIAMKSEDWDEIASAVNVIEGAENSERMDKSSEGVCLTEKYNEWTNGIIDAGWEKTTKIVSIEATLDESKNKKLKQNIDVQALPSFLTSLQIRKMAKMRYSVAAHMKVEVKEMHDMRGLRQHQIMWRMAISREIDFDSLIVVVHLKNWEVECMLISSGQYMEPLPILVPRRGSLLLTIQPGFIVDSLSWIQSYTVKLLFSGMVEGATHKFKFIKNFWSHFVPVIWFLHYVDAYSPAFDLSLPTFLFSNGKFS
ncbi:hypothetical protein FXO37_03635 [Capsicum annuum]|nr:hypothetical protein FXO37_03635 [Capsicum annuum]